MPTDSSTEILAQSLSQGRILKPAQERELSKLAAGFRDPQALVDELVRRGWLTTFQAATLLAGRVQDLVLGQYVLLEKLGEGGMGAVYKAYHRRLDRLVALKLIRKDRLTTSTAVERFLREARLAARLSHPNVVTVHDADEVGGTHFLVMEYVEGQDLGKLLKQKVQLPIALACDYIRQAACGLAHAQEKGLVHRDIKPGNILVPAGGGPIRLMDLGLARLQDSDDAGTASDLTQEGAVMGTPDYMAPEQIVDPHHADIRADIYSLGCSFYHLLALRPPFPGGTAGHKLVRQQLEEPAAIEALRPDLPPSLAAVVRRMIAKPLEQRYQTPQDVVAALGPFSRVRDASGLSLVPPSSFTELAAQEAPAAYTQDVPIETIQRTPMQVPVAVLAEPPLAQPVSAEEIPPLALPIQAPGRRRGLVMAAGVVVLLLIAFGAWNLLGGNRAGPTVAAQPAPRKESKKAATPPEHQGDAETFMERGRAAYERKDYDQAITDFNQAIKLDPKFAKAFSNRGNAYMEKDQVDKALADYSRAIELDPKFAIAYNNRGNAYSKQKDYDRAIADYTQAIRFAPQLAQPFYNRGNAYLDKRAYDKAIADYTEALRIEPGFLLALNNRGNAYRDSGDYKRAHENYSQALKLDPHFALALTNRGATHVAQEEYEAAVTAYTEAIELDPKSAQAYLGRGNGYYRLNMSDKAFADYSKAIQLDPKLADAYHNRGTIYLDRQEASKAIADYDKAIQLSPNYALAFLNRSKAHTLLGNQRQADEDRARALKLDPRLDKSPK
jgi:serine/threonine protein kinase/tetratricopeptide (TPR) repeat protein